MEHLEYSEFFYDGKTENFESALQCDKSDLNSDYNKNRLYCPECHVARLKFTSKTSKHRAYLSTWQGDNHPDWCSHAYEPASKQQIKEYYTNLSKDQRIDKLKASINAMIRREKQDMHHPIEKNPDENPALGKMKGKDGTANIYRLPTRSIYSISNIHPEEYDVPVLFYGKVLLRVEENAPKPHMKDPYYFLKIYNQSNKKRICTIYRANHRDNINENQVYLLSLIVKISKKTNSHPEIQLIKPDSILYQPY